MKKAKLTIDRGATLTLTFSFREEDGSPADFTDLSSALFRVQTSGTSLLEITGTIDVDNARVVFTATDTVTEALDFVAASWVALLTYGDGTVLKPVGGPCFLDAEDR